MEPGNTFDFYEEALRSYRQLIPKNEEGLVVFLLHQKISLAEIDKVFSHENLLAVIAQVQSDLGKKTVNKMHVQDNEIIRNLLRFFIRKNNKGGYFLKEYAHDFCNLVYDELFSTFNPSQLEIKIRMFRHSLDEGLLSQENFTAWYESMFQQNRNHVKKQVDILHAEVESSIRELNDLYVSDTANFIEKLRAMDEKIKSLTQDTQKLEQAFQLTGDIMEKINAVFYQEDSFAPSHDVFRKQRKDIKTFFDEIELKLTEVSFTIGEVRPQLERLYGSFHQRELDRKLERFVRYLFKTSLLAKNAQRRDELKFPESVSQYWFPEAGSKLLYPVYYHYLDRPEAQVQKLEFDPVVRQQQFEKAQSKVRINQRAVYHSRMLLSALKKNETVDLNASLEHILNEEKNLEIALKAAHLVFLKVGKDKKHSIQVNPQFQYTGQHKNLALWKTVIQRLNS